MNGYQLLDRFCLGGAHSFIRQKANKSFVWLTDLEYFSFNTHKQQLYSSSRVGYPQTLASLDEDTNLILFKSLDVTQHICFLSKLQFKNCVQVTRFLAKLKTKRKRQKGGDKRG